MHQSENLNIFHNLNTFGVLANSFGILDISHSVLCFFVY